MRLFYEFIIKQERILRLVCDLDDQSALLRTKLRDRFFVLVDLRLQAIARGRIDGAAGQSFACLRRGDPETGDIVHHSNDLVAGHQQIPAGGWMEGNGHDLAGHDGVDGGVPATIDGRVEMDGASVGDGHHLTGAGQGDLRGCCEIGAGVLGGDNAAGQLATLVVDCGGGGGPSRINTNRTYKK